MKAALGNCDSFFSACRNHLEGSHIIVINIGCDSSVLGSGHQPACQMLSKDPGCFSCKICVRARHATIFHSACLFLLPLVVQIHVKEAHRRIIRQQQGVWNKRCHWLLAQELAETCRHSRICVFPVAVGFGQKGNGAR